MYILFIISKVFVCLALLRELLRITRVGGEVMIQAWALEQDSTSRWDFAGTSSKPSAKKVSTVASPRDVEREACSTAQQDVLVPWKLQKRFFMTNDSDLDGAVEVMEYILLNICRKKEGM